MKNLHLLRHAKSSWNQPGLPDRERGLNKRGRRDAPRMGVALAALVEPMPIVVSPARRAQLTLEGLCQGWPELAALSHATDADLYTFSAHDLVDWLTSQHDTSEQLFLLGHNPALTDLVNWLTGEHSLDNLPTAGYAQLELDITQWQQLRPACGQLLTTILPRQLST